MIYECKQNIRSISQVISVALQQAPGAQKCTQQTAKSFIYDRDYIIPDLMCVENKMRQQNIS